MSDYLLQDQWSPFIQPGGPNTAKFWVACADVGDVATPMGDVTQTYCPDPAMRGKWKVASISKGPGDRTTFSITVPKGKESDYFDDIVLHNCPFSFYLVGSSCGRRDTFGIYDTVVVVENGYLTNRTYSGFGARQGTDESTKSYDISANMTADIFPLTAGRITSAEIEDMLAIVADPRDRCQSDCGEDIDAGEVLYASAEAGAAATANVYRSTNYGSTWTAMAVDPHGVGENVGALVAVEISRTVVRVLAFRTETAAGVAAEVGYTDDNGATWTNVVVGSTLTEFFGTGRSADAINAQNIFAVTDTGGGAAGNVFKSTDGGVTWTLKATGADALTCVHVLDENNILVGGDTNELLLSRDGGTNWTTLTGPAAMNAVDVAAVQMIDSQRFWVGYEGGQLYYTVNGGTTWTVKALPVPTGMASVQTIGDIQALDDHVIAVFGGAANAGADDFGAAFRTFDGGDSWESYLSVIQKALGEGFNQGVLPKPNMAVAVGDVDATPLAMVYNFIEA